MYIVAGEDFEHTNAVESLSAGSRTGDRVCVHVPLIDDDCFEKKEYFYIYVESEHNVEIHGLPYATIHIYDDDGRL